MNKIILLLSFLFILQCNQGIRYNHQTIEAPLGVVLLGFMDRKNSLPSSYAENLITRLKYKILSSGLSIKEIQNKDLQFLEQKEFEWETQDSGYFYPDRKDSSSFLSHTEIEKISQKWQFDYFLQGSISIEPDKGFENSKRSFHLYLELYSHLGSPIHVFEVYSESDSALLPENFQKAIESISKDLIPILQKRTK